MFTLNIDHLVKKVNGLKTELNQYLAHKAKVISELEDRVQIEKTEKETAAHLLQLLEGNKGDE